MVRNPRPLIVCSVTSASTPWRIPSDECPTIPCRSSQVDLPDPCKPTSTTIRCRDSANQDQYRMNHSEMLYRGTLEFDFFSKTGGPPRAPPFPPRRLSC